MPLPMVGMLNVPTRRQAILSGVDMGWATRISGGTLGALLCIVGAAGAAELRGHVEVWEARDGVVAPLGDNRDAVIFLTGFQEAPDPDARPRLIQRDKSFSVRVLAITQGAEVEFPNQDPLHHNVWSRSSARPFDLGLYKAPENKPLHFPRPGIITVFCNIHPQMIATILVLPNRRFAVTGKSGEYRIEGIPPGTHAVYAWVEGTRPVKQELHFTDERPVVQNFRLKLARIPVTHLNKEGRPYKQYRQYSQ